MAKQLEGYPELSPEQRALIEKIRVKGDELDRLCRELHVYVQEMEIPDGERFLAAEPQRWLALGKTQLQQGIGALVRAVAQQTSF
jgi:hypothetical protein